MQKTRVMSQNVIRNKTRETCEESQKSRDSCEIDGGVKQANTNHPATRLRRLSKSSEYSTKL